MKILYINNCHYRRGGADIVYLNTAELMISKGHEVYFFSQKNVDNEFVENEEFFADEINFRSLSFFSKIEKSQTYIYNTNASSNLDKLLKRIKPEIVHINLFLGGLSVSVLKTLKKMNVPTVMTVHDYRLLCPANAFLDNNNEICEKCKDGFFMRCALKKCSENNFFQSSIISSEAYFRKYFINPVDFIDKFIFVSKFSKDKHINFDEKFLTKSVHLYNFSSLILQEKEIAQYTNESYFLFIGRISVEKGVETMLEAFSKRKSKLKIVGDGNLLINLKDSYIESENIEFLGYKTGMELEEIKRKSSFIIVPSVCYENNPLSIIEAYSMGKPVIGSNIGGIPEIIINNETGFLFEPRNSKELSIVLDKSEALSKEDYISISKNALQFSKLNFEKELHYFELMKIYNELINPINYV